MCKKLGLNITFHMLRHDMATSMKATHRLDFKDIQGQMGHSTIQITMDIYTHLEEKVSERHRDFLEERFNKLVKANEENAV